MPRFLDYMHARSYNPQIGRFLSFDPVGGVQTVPQSLNRYPYVLGNPLKYTDPWGLSTSNSFDDDPAATFGESITVTGQSWSIFFSVMGLLSGPGSSNSFGFGLFGATAAPQPAPASPQALPQWMNPTAGCIRGCDSRGCGNFGASRDGGSRTHEGTDFLATPGQDVFAPTSGNLTSAVTRVYKTDARYTGFNLSGQNGYTIKAFYVTLDPSLIGKQVSAGDVLGTAQDLGLKYPGISNHVHLRIVSPTGQLIDPATVIPVSPQCP